MNENNISLISDIEPGNIIRTISPLVSELGVFSAAFVLYDTVYKLTNREGAVRLGEKLEEYFPLYGEIVETGLSPAEIQLTIENNVNAVAENLRSFSSIVVAGIESVVLDSLSRKLSESHVYFIGVRNFFLLICQEPSFQLFSSVMYSFKPGKGPDSFDYVFINHVPYFLYVE